MTSDPPRLRSASGSLESLLLRSAPSLEPPPFAEEEVWRRLEIVSAIGAGAGVVGIAGQTAASAGLKVMGKSLWLSVLKWGAVVAIVPTVGITTHFVMHRSTRPTLEVQGATPRYVVPPLSAVPAIRLREDSSPVDLPSAPAPSRFDPPKAESVQHRGHTAVRPDPQPTDLPSSLRAESLLLGTARAKLAAGDYREALDEVERLSDRFPRGRLIQEREIVAIDCLAALGDRQSMRPRALAFLSRFPNSPYSSHIGRLLEP